MRRSEAPGVAGDAASDADGGRGLEASDPALIFSRFSVTRP